MLLLSKGLSSHDLVLLKDAIRCVSEDCIVRSWGCTGKHYRYIAPKAIVDEHAAPGQVEDEEEQPDFIICILETRHGDDGGKGEPGSTSSLLFCGDSTLKIKGDGADEFMEKCLPDYRLRADVRISGFSTAGLKAGSITLGSQHLGIVVECSEEGLSGKLRDVLLQFTPAPETSTSEFIRQLLA